MIHAADPQLPIFSTTTTLKYVKMYAPHYLQYCPLSYLKAKI